MRLRTNKVLKFFALLLFALEFLAPALLVTIADTNSDQDKVQLIDGSHQQNILFSIFTEELTENEGGREGQKDTLLFSDFGFDSTFLQPLDTKPATSKYATLTSEQFDTKPALFKLNCIYRI